MTRLLRPTSPTGESDVAPHISTRRPPARRPVRVRGVVVTMMVLFLILIVFSVLVVRIV